jgi:hypothetical protein
MMSFWCLWKHSFETRLLLFQYRRRRVTDVSRATSMLGQYERIKHKNIAGSCRNAKKRVYHKRNYYGCHSNKK